MRSIASIVVASALAAVFASACGAAAAVTEVDALRASCVGGSLRACDDLVEADPDSAPLRTAMSTVVALGNACDAGYSVACTELGRRLRAGLADQPPQQDRAASQFAKACLVGEPSGCAELGLAFYNGVGVLEDAAYGLELIEGSCESGASVGCYYAGLVEDQDGTDARRATRLLTRGCELGHAGSCVDAGLRTERGRGAERNLWRATNLFARACDAGDPEGCRAMARMFELGRGVQRNRAFAARIYAQACAAGAPDGCVGQAVLQATTDPDASALALAELCANGHGPACEARGAFHAPGGLLVEDAQQRRRWLERSCELGHASGCARLALLVVEDDAARATTLLESGCSDSGDGLACALLGHVLAEGLGGVQVDGARADALYASSCDAGVEEGCLGLAHRVAADDPERALEALELACDMGRPDACVDLAQMMTDLGDDPAERIAIDDRACSLGSAVGCRRSALTWLWGDGVAFDLERGIDRLWAGCDGGDDDACRLLDEIDAGTGLAVSRRVLDSGDDAPRHALAEPPPAAAPLEIVVALDAVLEDDEALTRASAVARFVVTPTDDGARLELVDLQVTGDREAASELGRYLSPASRANWHGDEMQFFDALDVVTTLGPVPMTPPPWPRQPLGHGAVVEQLRLTSTASPVTATLEGRRERWQIRRIDTESVEVDLEVAGQRLHDAPLAEHTSRASLTASLALELQRGIPWPTAGRGSIAIDRRFDDGRSPALEIDLEIHSRPLETELAAVE